MSLIPDREALPHTLRNPRLCYFGILCGHVWIWDACHLASAAHPQMTLTVTIYISLTLFTLGLTIGALLARPTSKTLSWINWPLATLMALGTLALVLPLPQGLPAEQILQAAAVFCGIGMGWTYMQWSFFYAALETRDALACIFGAMLIGSLIKIPIDLIPDAWAAIVCAALPFASFILCDRAMAAQPPAKPVEVLVDPRRQRPYIKSLLGIAAYGLVIGIMQGIHVEADPAPKAALSLVHHLLEVATAAGIIWVVLVKRRSLHFSDLWRATLVFTATGVLALPLFGRAFSGWALVFVAVGQTLVVMLLWAFLADVAHRGTINPLAVFAMGWTAYCLPFPVGRAIGGLFTTSVAMTSLVSVIVYLLAMASIFMLDERDFSAGRVFADLEKPPVPPALFDALGDACKRLGHDAGLTDRELEVMELICKGRSKGYIAESLCISENTVRSHARHLYTKVGVHSKQELLDLLMEQMSGSQK